MAVQTTASSPRAKPRRTQVERREVAEQRLLDAATELIAEKGFANLVLSEVGLRAGFSLTLPVHYFKTKEALIAEVTHRIAANYADYLQAELHGVAGLAAVRTFIRTFIQHVLEFPVMRRAWFMILTEAASNSALSDTVDKPRASAVADLGGCIREGQRAGEIAAELNPDLEAAIIHGSLRGLISLWAINPSRANLRRLGAGLEQTISRSLAPR